eukprot:11798577-Alexandrium_andersonii.AAC.1
MVQPTGNSRTDVGAVSKTARFRLRTPDGVLRIRQGGLRIGADINTAEPEVDCGLHLAHLCHARSQNMRASCKRSKLEL